MSRAPDEVDATTPERIHYRSLRENTYLGQWDLPKDRDAVVVIEKVERFKPEVQKKKKRPDGTWEPEKNKRLKISFKGKKKAWLSGPVTQQEIARMYGPIANDWVGKAIALYVDPDVTMGRDVTGGIRVRPIVPKTAPTADPLDNPVDEEKARQIDEAAGRTEGR